MYFCNNLTILLELGGGSYVAEHLYTWQLAELFRFCHPNPCLQTYLTGGWKGIKVRVAATSS